MHIVRVFVAAVTFVLVGASAHAGMITTTFNANNGQSGNMFDVTVFGNDLLVTSLDLNLDPSQSWTVELYVKTGSYVGATNTPGAWTLVDSLAGVTSAGFHVPTNVDFADFLLLNSSTSAIYVTTTSSNVGIQYTDGTAEGAVFVSNADLAVLEGIGVSYAFGATGTFSPRVWNGTINYTAVQPVPEPATLSLLGLGLAGVATRRLRRKRS